MMKDLSFNGAVGRGQSQVSVMATKAEYVEGEAKKVGEAELRKPSRPERDVA